MTPWCPGFSATSSTFVRSCRDTELCHRENDKGGNKLEIILVSQIYKSYQSPSKFALTPCQKCGIERSSQKSNFPAENTLSSCITYRLEKMLLEKNKPKSGHFIHVSICLLLFFHFLPTSLHLDLPFSAAP